MGIFILFPLALMVFGVSKGNLMNEDNKKYKLECTEDKHKDHLCFLMCEGWHLTNREKYKSMVKDAAYRCQYCDRTAKYPENLCEPVEL